MSLKLLIENNEVDLNSQLTEASCFLLKVEVTTSGGRWVAIHCQENQLAGNDKNWKESLITQQLAVRKRFFTKDQW